MSAPAPAVLQPTSDVRAMREHDGLVRRIETTAERFAAAGNFEDAAACAQVAANIGWMNHTGRFGSERLEEVLRAGAATIRPLPYARPSAGEPKRILHVLTEAYATGGHTRLAWRWMEQDSTRVHGLALTRPHPVPDALAEAVASRGGIPIDVPVAGSSLFERAQRLRALAAGYDVVLLHAHPDDPVPSLAFGGPGARPATVLVNHADNFFWLAREVADVVASHRQVGSRLASERRGLPSERTLLLPLPLGEPPTADPAARDRARRELGIGPDQVVLLTVGSEYKFEPIGGAHFLDAAEPLVARHPEAVLIAVGPPDVGRFAQARQNTGGRVRALGGLASIDHLYAAADIYLESYPCSSGTAVREAAMCGSPVVTFAPDAMESEIVGSDASLANVWQRAQTVEEYLDVASELITDPAARARWGGVARESVLESYDNESWVDDVEQVYAAALAAGPIDLDELSPVDDDLTGHDSIIYRIHAYSGKHLPVAQLSMIADVLDTASRSPAIRKALGTLAGAGCRPDLRMRYPLALAAPSADAAVVDATLSEFRMLSRVGIVEGCTITAPGALLDGLVPLIEAALEAGPELDVDLVPAEDPRHAYAPGTLVVRVDGDRFGALPPDDYPLQHAVA